MESLWGRPSACGGLPGRPTPENFDTLPHYPKVMRKRRRLPHFDVLGQPLFVTFRLHDRLPANRLVRPRI